MFGTDAVPNGIRDQVEVDRTMLSGDVLFAGSIGRTDLPGGNHDQLMASMTAKILPLDDAIQVLPGHGETTTIGKERASNPFLEQLLKR